MTMGSVFQDVSHQYTDEVEGTNINNTISLDVVMISIWVD